MRPSCLWSALLLLPNLAASARGEETALKWKLKKGDQFFLQEKVLQKQSLKFMGTELKQDLSLERVTRFIVLDDNEKGTVLEQKVLSVRFPKGKGFRSAEAKLLGQMEGAIFKVTLGPDRRVARFEGYEAFLKKVSHDEKIGKMLQTLLPPEALSRAVEALFSFLPDKPVKAGARWNWDSVRPLGPLGSLKVVNTCTWKEPGKKESRDLALIEVIPEKATYVPPGNKDPAFQVVKGDIRLDTEKTRTAITFNIALGRPVRLDRTTQLFGSLTVASMGVRLNLDMEHEETIEARFLEKAP